jgi:hypothetical protein
VSRLLSGELEGGAKRDRRNSLRREVILVHDVLDESSLRDDESSLGDEVTNLEKTNFLSVSLFHLTTPFLTLLENNRL